MPRTTSLVLAAGLAMASAAAATDTPDGDIQIETIVRSASDVPYSLGDPFDVVPANKALAGFVFGGGSTEGDGPNGIAFTPDGASFVIAHRESKNLVIWDTATLSFLGGVDLPGAPVSIAITPDGTTAVVALVDTDNAAIVDLGTLTVSAVVPIGESPGAVVIMPAGDLAVVSAAFDSELVVIDLNTNTEVRRISDIGFSQTVAFSTIFLQRLSYSSPVVVDNDRIVNLDRFRPNPQPDEIQFINVRTGAVNRIVPATTDPNDIDISADGTTAVVAHANQPSLTVIDVATEAVTGAVGLPENANFSAQIAVNNDATKAAYTISNDTRTIDLTTGIAGPTLGTATLNDLITTPDGNRVAGIGFRGTVIDLNTGTNLGNLNQVVSTDLGAMSPDGSRIVQLSTTFGEDLVVIEPDATPQFIDSRFTGPDFEGDRMVDTAVSPDGTKVVGLNRVSGNAVVYDAATMTVLAQVGEGRRADAVGISPDGSKAVIAYGDSFFAGVIDLNTFTFNTVPMGRRGSRVLFSPDSTYAYIPVVADGDGVTRINLNTLAVEGPKLTTGNMVGFFGYAFGQSSGVAISPDGSTIAAAGSFDGLVSFIDAANWTDLGDVFGGTNPSFVAFSPDGTKLAVTTNGASGIDATIDVYDVATQSLTSSYPLVGQALPGFPTFMDNDRVLLAQVASDTVSVVDVTNGVPVGDIPVFPVMMTSTTISGLAYDAAADRIYVAYGNSSVTMGGAVGFETGEEGFLDVYDGTTLSFIEQVDLQHGPGYLGAASDFSVLATGAPIGDGAVIVTFADPCPGDIADDFGFLGSDGMVSFGDFLALLGLIGPCPGGTPGCTGDIADDFGFLGGDGMVSFGDFLALLGLIGPCP